MSKGIPPEGTIEHFDFLLEALIEESLIQGYFGDNEDAISFHAGMLRQAYIRALERKYGDDQTATNQGKEVK